MRPGEPFIRFDWIVDNLDEIAQRLGEHLVMVVAAVVIGFVLSFALAMIARRWRGLYGPILAVTGTLYAIPSLALFVLLIPITGLTLTTGIVALVLYTLLILIRNIVVALDGVPADVTEAATGMGFSSRQRFWRIELPIAVPVIIAGLRIATVSTVAIATLAFLAGAGGLGQPLYEQNGFKTNIIIVGVLAMGMALALDLVLVVIQRLVTPWRKARTW